MTRTKLLLFPALIVVLVSVFFAIGCSGGGHSADEHYFLVTSNSKIPYWQAAHDGLRQAAVKSKIKVEFVGPDTYDPKAQQEELRRVIGTKPTGILISPADAKLLQPDIDSAISQGIPVITIDSDSPNSKRLMFIGTNNYQAGLMGGRAATKALNGKGNVVVFGLPAQANINERLHGYRDAFAEAPGIKIVEEIDIQGDPRVAWDKTNDIINKKQPVDGFICLEALAGKEVADVLNRNNVKGKTVMAFDADEGTLDWIKKGVINATIAQKPYTMAYYGLLTLDMLHHDPPGSIDKKYADDPFSPLPSFIDTGATLVDKNNVDSYISARASSKQ